MNTLSLFLILVSTVGCIVGLVTVLVQPMVSETALNAVDLMTLSGMFLTGIVIGITALISSKK